ncbi:hypothetical protein F7R21_32080 [Burkholderia latens]|uniref:Uncharacterized protein n=1 Tax=Burkholderia latens TaxID=488446 RepID=A0A6H9SG49_9BURK|nr:hypothetical protein F7R21_32080 [Burkholderia latens]
MSAPQPAASGIRPAIRGIASRYSTIAACRRPLSRYIHETKNPVPGDTGGVSRAIRRATLGGIAHGMPLAILDAPASSRPDAAKDWGAAISSISSRGNSDEDQQQSPDPRILRALVEQSDNWGHGSRCSASIAGPLLRVSRRSRIARAEATVVSRDNRPTAVSASFQFIRMGHAVRAGQLDAARSSAVRGRFDCAGCRPASAGLDRMSVVHCVFGR